MKEKFLNVNMTWKKVIIFSIITAVITATLNVIPMLNDTSFQDIAINLDMWIFFAVHIIINCKSEKEAVFKTFLFFLISQPLIYLIEVPFCDMGFGIFMYYKHWAFMTILTLPGAFIAYQLKRKDWLSVSVLLVPTVYYGNIVARYFYSMILNFPHHLISIVSCLAICLFLIIVMFDEKKKKTVLILGLIISLIVSFVSLKPDNMKVIDLPDGVWEEEIEKDCISIEYTDEGDAEIIALKDGTTMVTFTNENKDIIEYLVTVSGGGITINQFN